MNFEKFDATAVGLPGGGGECTVVTGEGKGGWQLSRVGGRGGGQVGGRGPAWQPAGVGQKRCYVVCLFCPAAMVCGTCQPPRLMPGVDMPATAALRHTSLPQLGDILIAPVWLTNTSAN